ncbi:MAG: chemotaxis protein CheA [Nitrospirae bacterium]|nr:chemotaxis protein CheA [Nitrospirota bacterium]
MSNAEQHKAVYMEEASELLAELETSLLELEENAGDAELIGRIFRALHTIKGSGAMFGFDDIAAFTHEVETSFDMVRNGLLPVTKKLIDLTLSSRDYIKTLLDEPESSDKQRAGEIIYSLKKLSPKTIMPDDVKNSPAPPSPKGNESEKSVTYRIRFRPPVDIFMRGINPVLLINELYGLGECSITAQTDAIPQIVDIDPESCYTYWDIVLTTDLGTNAIRDVFIFIEDDSEINITVLNDSSTSEAEAGHKKIGEILVERGDLTEKDIQKALRKQKPLGEFLINDRMVDAGKIESALAEQKHVKEIKQREQQKEQPADTASSIRVASDKLDSLVNLVGEMVTVQARLSQLSSFRNDPDLLAVAEEVERLTGELRDQTMSIRMLPIGTTFSKFKRLVRDLSKELGKRIELTTEGAETELDKTVIEKLNDPMVHLIRNCIDHGIETPDVRSDIGKPAQGMVRLSAKHSGAYVLIEIMDDGAGLDADAIRAKAVEKGMISLDAELTEKEIYSLVLAPGFSTAKTVTNVSGRGVGMDVVKRAIDNLRGSIGITSQKGIGTTITLKLPLTLAIIEGLLVQIGIEYFVLPLSAVEECVELTRQDIANAHGRHLANVRGQIVPYIRLRGQFVMDGRPPDIEQIVIVGIEGRRVGFVVDNVVGEHQTVIKTLGRVYKDIEGISGATILGDGTVALILDIQKLVQTAEREEVRG